MNLLIVTQKVDANDPILGFFHDWIKEFSVHFRRVYVICLEKREFDLPQNVEVFSLGKERGGNKLTYTLRFFYYLVVLHSKYKNVFVHMNQIYIVLAGFWWKITGKKIGLWYAHGSVSNSLALAEKLSDIIFTSTEAGFKLPSKKIKIVGQGIDTNIFKPKEYRKKGEILNLITVGRISGIKNYETILRAMNLLAKNSTDFKLNIIGGPITKEDKQYLDKLKGMVSNFRLENKVNFWGSKTQKEVIIFLQDADIFVNASKNKSLDKAIVEAMSAGLPVISSNESFRIISPDKSLCSVEGDERDMVGKIIKVGELNSDERGMLATKMRGVIEQDHNLDNLISKITAYYE